MRLTITRRELSRHKKTNVIVYMLLSMFELIWKLLEVSDSKVGTE